MKSYNSSVNQYLLLDDDDDDDDENDDNCKNDHNIEHEDDNSHLGFYAFYSIRGLPSNFSLQLPIRLSCQPRASEGGGAEGSGRVSSRNGCSLSSFVCKVTPFPCFIDHCAPLN